MREDVAAALELLEQQDPRASKALRRRGADLERVEGLLRADEQVVWVQAEDHIPGTDGKIDGRTIAHGVLCLTTERLLFAGETAIGQFEYSNLVSAIEPPPTFGGLRKLVLTTRQGEAIWFTLTQKAASAALLATLARYLGSQPQPTGPTPRSDASPSLVDQLQQLADLHTSGALSDQEFEAAKARLLGA